MQLPFPQESKMFVTGNEAVAWAALAAGAEIMYGYPITPQNEIMHYWTRLAPEYGRLFLQTEDELSAGFTTIGGVLAGKRAFSATAGPGTVLFQEPLSMAEMMRLPVVLIVQQRGGPSTATVIYSQQEVMLTAYGGNGEGLRVVYSTASVQELFDYTIRAFDTAWRYRLPTIVLGDGYQAKMRESATMYSPPARGFTLCPTETLLGKEGMPGRDRPPVHLRNAYSMEEELYEVLSAAIADYERAAPGLIEYAVRNPGAEVMILAHGIVSRAAEEAVENLTAQGLNLGYFRPITLRPFPGAALQEAVAGSRVILVVESAAGQLFKLARIALGGGYAGSWQTLFRPGMGITAEEISDHVRRFCLAPV